MTDKMEIRLRNKVYNLGRKGFSSYPLSFAPVTNFISEKKNLNGKTILITGGNQGIGFSIGELFAKVGGNVILSGRDEKKLKDCCSILSDYSVSYIKWDISDFYSFNDNLKKACSLFGKIDILINNAGVTTDKDKRLKYFDTTPNHFSYIHDINVKGTYFMCQLVANYMMENKIKGTIINIASNTGIRPGLDAYQISKWGVVGITKGFASILEPYGIDVYGIAPGPIKTSMTWRKGRSIIWPDSANGRLGYPEEVAELALLMIGAKLSPGQIVTCDGGQILK